MTTLSTALLGLGLLFAAGDWWAVATAKKRVEYVCKPAVMVALLGAALSLHPVSQAQRSWFVAALVLGLAGDVFLMLPSDRFVPGLVAFLLGHLAYIGGFLATGLTAARVAAAALALVLSAAALLPRILAGARAGGPPGIVPAVTLYVVVISAMVAGAAGSRQPLAVVPASLFYVSDAMIAWRRFVAPRPWMSLAVIITYHLAQAGLVAWLTL